MNDLVVVVAQINLLVGDIKGNAKRIIEVSQTAVDQHQADLVLFPELTVTSYPPEDLLLRPGFFSRCESAIKEIVQSVKDVCIVVGYPKKREGLCYNQAAVIQNGSIVASYEKQLLPNYEVFDEKRYFTAGSQPCVFDLQGVKIGINICEDLWYDGPACQAVSAGAQIILSLNASPYDRQKVCMRQTMLERRVAKIHVPIVYCNLVGGQDELVFDGGSMVIDATGQRCQQAAYYQEELMPIRFTVDDKKINVVPKTLPDRLSEEENIYRTLVLGIHDYIEKNHFPAALVGLSGGVDSALTLSLAVDALGPDRVRAVMMPSRYTLDISKEDAAEQAHCLRVVYDEISIDTLFDAYLNALSQQFVGTTWSNAEENIQARIRGNLLMAISNKTGSIVLATGNRSELAVGYATLYGDMCGGFSPLKDISKMMVYRLSRYRNTLSPAIPQRVIEREPSAELAEGQLDKDTLPPYAILDEILYRYIDNDEDPRHICEAGFNKEVVDRVVKMVNNNEYKRRQAPIGIRTTQRAFGKDRRYPITSGYTQNI